MKHQFHNLDFSLNERRAIEAYCDAREWTKSDTLESAIELGMKVSFTYDTYHDCALMSLTPKIEEHPFYGYVVSVRHTDIERMFSILLWLTSEGWEQLEPPAEVKTKYDW